METEDASGGLYIMWKLSCAKGELIVKIKWWITIKVSVMIGK